MLKPVKPFKWLPSLYVMQGIPFALVSIVAPVLYKNFNFKNTDIAFYTSLLTLPWIFKCLLAPALEKFNKKNLVMITQLIMTLLILTLSLSLNSSHWYFLSLLILFMIAMCGAIYDINSDGIYLSALNFSLQAKWIGMRTLSYQIGKLICRFGLLFFVGLFTLYIGKDQTWKFSFIILALLILFFLMMQQKYLPDVPEQKEIHYPYQTVLREFFKLSLLPTAMIFILFYEFPEAQLLKIVPLYLMDNVTQGGLGLNVENVGIIFGGIGMISMLIGISLSGFLLNHFGLKKCLIPFTGIAVLAYSSYLLLPSYHSLKCIILCVAFAEFGFGLSNGAYMLFLMRYFSKGQCFMSLYALGTAIMLLGAMLAGSVSGYLQLYLGYQRFFIWVAMVSLGTLFLAFYHSKRML